MESFFLSSFSKVGAQERLRGDADYRAVVKGARENSHDCGVKRVHASTIAQTGQNNSPHARTIVQTGPLFLRPARVIQNRPARRQTKTVAKSTVPYDDKRMSSPL
jgi:hypothetical protein